MLNTYFMKRSFSLKLLGIILLCTLTLSYQLKSQMPQRGGNQVRITGWTDDSHYLIQTFDSEKRPVIKSIDVRTGKSVVVVPEKSARELLSETLPSGVVIGMNDVISPDMNSVIIVKDNDLYYFTKGGKELRRLTKDDIPEVNTRFSPEGKKIAYTKNKDLYVFDINNNKETRLTFDASDRIYNGYASWVYMEEILGRASRYAAFWWSPDSRKIAFLRPDG